MSEKWFASISIDRRANIALENQIANALEKILRDTTEQDIQYLPEVHWLAKQLQTNDATVTHAYNLLIQKNLVTYESNKYMIAQNRVLLNYLSGFETLAQALRNVKKTPTLKPLSNSRASLSKQDYLYQYFSASLHTQTAIVYADTVAIALIERYSVDALTAFNLETVEHSDTGNYVQRFLHIRNLPKSIASSLNSIAETAVFVVTKIHRDYHRGPVYALRIWFSPSVRFMHTTRRTIPVMRRLTRDV